jgi:hypothetical protein
MIGISTGESHLHCIRRPPISAYPSNLIVPPIVIRNATTPQAAKNVRASQSALFEIFERLEAFFQRLEIYTKAALDQKMVDTVTKILAEVLNITGIATKDIKKGRTSEFFLLKDVPH